MIFGNRPTHTGKCASSVGYTVNVIQTAQTSGSRTPTKMIVATNKTQRGVADD